MNLKNAKMLNVIHRVTTKGKKKKKYKKKKEKVNSAWCPGVGIFCPTASSVRSLLPGD